MTEQPSAPLLLDEELSADIQEAARNGDQTRLLAIIAHVQVALFDRIGRLEREYLRR